MQELGRALVADVEDHTVNDSVIDGIVTETDGGQTVEELV